MQVSSNEATLFWDVIRVEIAVQAAVNPTPFACLFWSITAQDPAEVLKRLEI
jgi:hypothetical protein